jgi:membrane protein implicated in regulation of membrane protease activity
MNAHWIWWALGVALMAAELATGTLYLLVIALGMAAGGLAAIVGADLTVQILAAAIVALGGWAVLRRRRADRSRVGEAPGPGAMLDVGQEVEVTHWQPGGHARVRHRGAEWPARLAAGAPPDPQPGRYVIHAVDGTHLVLAPLDVDPPRPGA